MGFSPLIEQLITALRCLPGVGQKTAQRMAFHLLVHDRQGAQQLSASLEQAAGQIRHCGVCRNLSEQEICDFCSSPQRDERMLCVVESPADVMIIDQATGFNGKYFVLLGRLSPLDGVGPEELGLHKLAERLDSGVVEELILATNSTVESEATAHYLSEMAARRGIRATRIAHGVPLGGELEYVDNSTLSQAFSDRREIL